MKKKLSSASLLSLSLSLATMLMAPLAHAQHDDVTVLQAWFSNDELTANPAAIGHGGNANKVIDASLCSTSTDQYGEQDCSAAAMKAEGEPLASLYPMSPQGTDYCQTIEIRTVTPLDVYNSPVFAGIGFSFNDTSCEEDIGAQQSGVFVQKQNLKQVGTTVILKDGTPAMVHAFFAQGECLGEGSDGYNFEFGMLKFKPYAKYTVGDPNVRWDSANDYRMGCVPIGNGPGYEANHTGVTSFDRQGDLLKQ